MAGTHARKSPSGADGWMVCAGKTAMEEGYPDSSSEFADDGTASHDVGAHALQTGTDCKDQIGRVIAVGSRSFTVDAERAAYVQIYVDLVRSYVGPTGQLLVEQRLPLSQITGEADACGTSDAVILRDDELIIVDLKYGVGVEVSAESNRQMMIYAMAAYDQYVGLLGDFKRFRVVISQPRVREAPSEWDFTLAELEAFRAEVTAAAKLESIAFDNRANWKGKGVAYLQPSTKGCKWCKAKAVCPALAKHIEEEIGADFETVVAAGEAPAPDHAHSLATQMAAVDLIEDWIKAVRAEVERRLVHGVEVPGWKLVEGKRGGRAWTSEDAAEAEMKAMRLTIEERCNLKVKSPPQMEKVLKESPRKWSRLEALIAPQSPGKPSVAPASDKRPALSVMPSVDDFADETGADLAS